MAKLDFTALNKIAYRGFETAEEQEKKDALIEQGFTIVEDEKLPFDEPQPSTAEEPQLNAPRKVEIKQIFSLRDDMEMLCSLYKAGRMELLDKITIFRESGAVYAHFMLSLEKRSETASDGLTSASAVNSGEE